MIVCERSLSILPKMLHWRNGVEWNEFVCRCNQIRQGRDHRNGRFEMFGYFSSFLS